jgi:hypothetical protein
MPKKLPLMAVYTKNEIAEIQATTKIRLKVVGRYYGHSDEFIVVMPKEWLP